MKQIPSSRMAAAFIGVLGFVAQSYALPLTPTSITMSCFDEGAPNPQPTADTQCVKGAGSVTGTKNGNEFSWWLRLADPTFLRMDMNGSDGTFNLTSFFSPLADGQSSLFSLGSFTMALLGLDDAVLLSSQTNGSGFPGQTLELSRQLSSPVALDIKSIQLSLTCSDGDINNPPACPDSLNLTGLVFEKKIRFEPSDPNDLQSPLVFDARFLSIQRATSTVPEPSTLALLGLGVAGMAMRRKPARYKFVAPAA